jgi:hypothetical protein
MQRGKQGAPTEVSTGLPAADAADIARLVEELDAMLSRLRLGPISSPHRPTCLTPIGQRAESEQARQQFWLMPLMHSEDLAVQEAALPRFSDPRTADFARRHRDVIARFGRFPHRNALLGRVSCAEELAFLQTPGSRF